MGIHTENKQIADELCVTRPFKSVVSELCKNLDRIANLGSTSCSHMMSVFLYF